MLKKIGLTYEDLNSAEKETLNTWIETLQKGQLSVEKIREYITSLREAVGNEISKEPTFIRIFIFKVENPNLIRLQARLRNYILLEAFLSTPERAKEQIENIVQGMTQRK